ncbi:MAG TPA: putative Ig domain-containing protein [Chthoniobacteraceae bacterium]|jgi:hypothetical protein|nr:putative Ig domain-containing protein [Chthoniobacteraceae bacterium]
MNATARTGRIRSPCCLAVLFIAAVALLYPATGRAQNLYVQFQSSEVNSYNAATGGLVKAGLISGLSDPASLALSGDNLFVLNSGNGTVGVYNAVTGAVVKPQLISGLSGASAMVISGSDLFISSTDTGAVAKYAAGTGVLINPEFVSGLSNPSALAVSGNALLVADEGTGIVGQYGESTGAPLNAAFITGLSGPTALAVGGQYLYVASGSNGTIGEYLALTGAPFNASLITGLSSPSALAVRSLSLYVASGGTAGMVSTYISTTGALIDSTFISGVPNVSGMAVTPPAPVITSKTRAVGTAGFGFLYQILASNNPASYSSSKLPPGLALNVSTGLISGTATESGTFAETISASNLGGTGSADISIVLHPPVPPVFTSASNASCTADYPFTFTITARNYPASYSAIGLPPGLNFNTQTGRISGAPTETGQYYVSIGATNLAGTTYGTLKINIAPPPHTSITSPPSAAGTLGVPFKYRITATYFPTGFNATGLPPGLTVNTSNGVINGTPAEMGKFPVQISATNLAGSRNATLALTIRFDFAAVKGAYRGFATLDGTDAGQLLVTVMPNGSFTGYLVLAGGRYPVAGTFDLYGEFDHTLRIGNAKVDLNLAIDPAPAGVSGTVSVVTASGSNSFEVSTNSTPPYSSRTIPAGIAGRYTAVFPALSGSNLPQAPGYATMTVANTGAIHLTGKLGDGTAFTAGSRLQSDGTTWILFVPINYGKDDRGSIAGTMTFGPNSGSDGSGVLQWIKPGQFTTDVSLLAAKYTPPPLASGSATLTLSGGGLASAIVDDLTISSKYKVGVSGTNEASLTLTPSTGAFSGKFLYPPAGRKIPFGGVIYQLPTPNGNGLFLGTGETGAVSIVP